MAFAADTDFVDIDKIVLVEKKISDDAATIQDHGDVLPVTTTAASPHSVVDVVGTSAGVHVQRYGGLEAATAISIRGSGSHQVEIFLDGIPLDSAAGLGIDLGLLSVDSLAQIRVYKSFTPSELGGGAMGGVIDLQSHPIHVGLSQKYHLGYGSFNTMAAGAQIQRGGKEHDFLFGMDYRRTSGDFTFLDDNGTPVNLTDDSRVERQNNESQTIHPYLKWQYHFDDQTSLSFTNHFFRVDSGVAGLQSFQSQTASRSLTEEAGRLALTHEGFWGGDWQVTQALTWRFIKSQFSDPRGEIGLGAAQDNDNRTVILGDRVLWRGQIRPNLVLFFGPEYTFEYFLPKDYAAATPVGSSSTRQQVNFLLEPRWQWGEDKLVLSGQVKSLNAFYDVNNDDPSLMTPGSFSSQRWENQLAAFVAAQFFPSDAVTLKASAGRAIRLPKFIEMFGDQGYVLGNPGLTSEKSFKYDVGGSWRKSFSGLIKKASVSASYFESHTEDLIQFELASGFAQASNVGKALIRGVEAQSQVVLSSYVTWSQDYTLQITQDRALNLGKRLVGRPEHEYHSRLEFNRHPWGAYTGLAWIANQYLDVLNTQKIDFRFTANVGVWFWFKDRYRLGAEILNLTDSQIVDAIGFPLPGRSFWGRIEAQF